MSRLSPRLLVLACASLAAAAAAAPQTQAATSSLKIVEHGASKYFQDVNTHASWGAIIRNTSTRDRLMGVKITVRFYNRAGRLVASDSQDLGGLAPKATTAAGNAGAEFCGSSCSSITRYTVTATYRSRQRASTTPAFKIDRCSLQRNSWGDWIVGVRVFIPWTAENVPLTAILRDASGHIVGGYTGLETYYRSGWQGDQIGPFDGNINASRSRTRCYTAWRPRV